MQNAVSSALAPTYRETPPNHSDDAAAAAQSVRDRADLHVHLNGAVPVSTLLAVLTNEATTIPDGFSIDRDLARRQPSPTLSSYLEPWRVLRLLPRKRENLDRLTFATFASFAANQVRFVELRSSVLYLADLQGCSTADAMMALIESTRMAAAHHKVRRGLVLSVTRSDRAVADLSMLLQAYRDLEEPEDIVGIDLAGDEEINYPPELPSIFRQAKERYGLGVTIHAGETGRGENIRTAVDEFGADRIGHGSAAGRHPELMDLLADKDVCVEVCPISNRLTGALSLDEAHPLVEFERHGTPFVICSDNPGIHDRGLAEDHLEATREGLSAGALSRQYALARRYSFTKGDW